MYIVRWLKGHPLISIWVLGIIAILLSWSGSNDHKKGEAYTAKVETPLSKSQNDTMNEGSSGKTVAEVFEENSVEVLQQKQLNNNNSEEVVSNPHHSTHEDNAGKNGRDVEKIQAKDSLTSVESKKEASSEEAIISSLPEEAVKGAVEDIKTSNKEDMLLMAREAFWNNGLDEAAEIYVQLIKLEPDVLDHKGELGNVFWRQGYPKKAAELYSEIAIPMIKDGKTEPVANMLGFIGLFYPDRAAQINDHLQAEVSKKK